MGYWHIYEYWSKILLSRAGQRRLAAAEIWPETVCASIQLVPKKESGLKYGHHHDCMGNICYYSVARNIWDVPPHPTQDDGNYYVKLLKNNIFL